MSLEALLKEAGMDQEAGGEAIGVSRSAFSHKLARRRPIRMDEAQRLRKTIEARLGRPVSLDEMFPADEWEVTEAESAENVA